METAREYTKADLIDAAAFVGRRTADVGDFYDVVESVAQGYSQGVRGVQRRPAGSPAHTTPSQIEPAAVASVEPDSTAAQGPPATDRESVLKWELVALEGILRSASEVLRWRVDDARDAGMTWSEIGDILEVSKQAAQQKYGGAPDANSHLYPDV